LRGTPRKRLPAFSAATRVPRRRANSGAGWKRPPAATSPGTVELMPKMKFELLTFKAILSRL